MPYPILKLPYGLQRRLRSLSTRKELYRLQIAIGLEKNYLRPLQMCNTYPKDHFYLQNNEGKLDLATHHQFFDLQEVVNWDNENLTLAQDPEFFLAFYCADPPEDAVQVIRQKLGIYFKEFTYETGHIDGVFVIKLGLEISDVTWMWFQVNPRTNRNNECNVYHLPI
uniref:FBA_2 domain-containing protein n=1 Tax=Panagrellus redivivus TaxID=6233 RepID=A0A7E4VGS9_PANRE